ncbi:sacsin-like [Mytilus edulis]|uniref:sacsin-like n=1 Tax=Mytilus edulis TaxID=6550 RepID=UPI0039EF54DB
MASQLPISDNDQTSNEKKWFPMERPSLLKQLQNIMREYPDDVQIFYEFVQNAEDAKAAVMKIISDSRNIDPGGCYAKYLKSPGLCVYNDAVFEEDDWNGITSLYLSHKEHKAYKIGRYGQGFKSVFHITDYAVVISGHFALLIDPFKVNNECHKTNLAEFGEIVGRSGILNSFGLSMEIIRKGYYNGTIFWFPLRTSPSQLSSNEYSSSKLEGAIEMLKTSAHHVLLFMKYLKEIEVSSISGQLLHKTTLIFDDTKMSDCLCSMWDKIENGTCDSSYIAFNCTTHTISNQKRSQCQKSQLWTVLHYYAGHSELKTPLATLVEDSDIACLPYVGIAFQRGITDSKIGRVFNFLPLPATVKTNLPVHVNANFALSQNRQHLKLSTGKSSDKFVQWNVAVVTNLVPIAYMKLVEHLIEQSTQNNNPNNQVKMVYDCMPQHELFYDSFWRSCVTGFYNRVVQLPVFFTERNNGKWVNKDSIILYDVFSSDMSKCQHVSIRETIKTVLLHLKKNVFDLHNNMKMLIRYGQIEYISPLEIVQYLNTSNNVIQLLSPEQKIHLLSYIMNDSEVNILDGLKLLPLQSGGFESFHQSSIEEEVIYVGSSSIDSTVFPGLEHRFVSNDLPVPLMKALTAMAKKDWFQLKMLEYKNIPQLLGEVFQNHGEYSKDCQFILKHNPSALSIQWIEKIWSIINRTGEGGDLQDFEKLPLIPQYNPERPQIDSLFVLKGNYVLTCYGRKDRKNLPKKVLDILLSHGITNLDWNKVIESSNIIGKYINYPTYESIMELFKNEPQAKQQIQTHAGFKRDLWMSQKTSAISFGQREDLVTRLKGILDCYPSDHSILKEMIQNADDAGAKEIHIVYDKRTHSTNEVFDNWKPLQGPAMCIFNDACFTDENLEGIKRLGVGSKGDDKTKTGQFGIGFNSVYHLTDAPCILALGPEAARGGCFCVLDPHCRYAPLAYDGDPGMFMEAAELMSDYPDVFNTFLSSKELKRMKGTWLRFPIRTSYHEESQICNRTFSSKDMEDLLLEMEKDVEECLLFLLNIKHIIISSIDIESIHKIHCSVHVSGVGDANRTQSKFKEQLNMMNKHMKISPSSTFSQNIEEFKYVIDIKFHSKVASSWWMIVQTLGFTDPQAIDHSLKDLIERKEIKFLPRGGVAFRLFSLANLSMNSKAFCLLPLPVETGLSFHVNGHFAIDISRNKLWGSEESSSSDFRRIWNLELIRRCIAYAYAGGISFLNENMMEKKFFITNFFISFPSFSTAKNIFWKELVSYVFYYIKKRKLLVYPIIKEKKENYNVENDWSWNIQQFETRQSMKWVRFHNHNENPILVDDLMCQHLSSTVVDLLRKCFLTLGMKLITLPAILQSSMLNACQHLNKNHGNDEESCICIQNISPKAAIHFFKSSGFDMNYCFSRNEIEKVHQVKLCLEYCLRCDDLKVINGLPLLLRNDLSVGIFLKQNKLILSTFVDLLPESSGKFVHKSLVGITRLRELSFEKLTLTEFARLLPNSLDSRFKTDIVKDWNPSEGLLSKEWLKCFWEFVDTRGESIEVLEDWALLPVSMMQNENLLALKFCEFVVDYDSFEKCQQPELYHILRKLPLPTATLKSTFIDHLSIKYECSSNILRCVYYYSNYQAEKNLTETDRINLVSYLVIGLKRNEERKIDKLKNLSLFTTMEDKVISLQTKFFLSIHENISMPGLENLCKEKQLTILRYYPEWWKLYTIIDCNIINISDWYSRYVLPYFEKVYEDFHIFHLTYINDNLLENANVISALREVRFIRDGQFINRADDYFNPVHPLFEKLCNNKDFPPPPFDNVRWRKLLVNAGLVNEISERALLHFVRMMETSLPTEDIFSKLKHLLPELYYFMAREKKISPNFIQKLSQIRFLLIDRNESKYEDIHKSLNTNLRFTSFKETISHDQIELVWTAADVLPRYAMPSDRNLLKKLKNIEEPSFEVVMQHAKNICSALFCSCADHDETVLTTIMEQIYRYLLIKNKNFWELKGIPLIHIIKHKKFAYASEVVKNINNSKEIPPYLLKAPIEYGQFFKFFNCLGMTDEPTVATYSKVLWKIHKTYGHSTLGPNEIMMVQKALQGFMREIQQLQKPVDDLEVNELYLMSEHNQLLPASELYYETLEIRRERLENENNLHFLADFGCLGINIVELPKLFELIPDGYRPLSVHSIVTENLAFHELNESETALKLLEILTSETFINAILRICKHDQKMSNDLTVQDMQRISARLRRLRIFGVSKLETNLMSGEGEIHGTKSDKSCFYCDEKEIIYIHDQRLGVDTWLCRYGIELERMLRVVCYGKFHTRSLLCIFNTISLDFNSLHERLTELGITLLEEDLKNRIWYPLPGSLVPREVHSRLRKPLVPITVNQYAVIPCELSETDKTNNDKLRYFEDTFIYVIVTTSVCDSVETLQHYMVNAGKQQDIKIDTDLILEIQPVGTPTETDVDSDIHTDETGVDELDSRTLHSAREFHVFRLPNPQKQMGWKWFTQAKYDLDAGYATLDGIDRRPFKGYNWICLQCQQATEKAVKAAQYATDANEVQRSHFFIDNIPNGDESLSTLCQELSPLVGHINSLRYPDNYSPIPAERYNRDGATKALCLTDKILKYVSEKYFM